MATWEPHISGFIQRKNIFPTLPFIPEHRCNVIYNSDYLEWSLVYFLMTIMTIDHWPACVFFHFFYH